MMRPEKVIEVLKIYRGKLPEPVQLEAQFYELHNRNIPKLYEAKHMAWMCDRAIEFVKAGRISKAMRWLGWLNYGMHEHGFLTLNQVKELSRPSDAHTRLSTYYKRVEAAFLPFTRYPETRLWQARPKQVFKPMGLIIEAPESATVCEIKLFASSMLLGPGQIPAKLFRGPLELPELKAALASGEMTAIGDESEQELLATMLRWDWPSLELGSDAWVEEGNSQRFQAVAMWGKTIVLS